MKKIAGGLCAINSVFASGIHAGFKANKKDLGLIYFPKGATVAGVYTKNAIQSHHIAYDRHLLEQHSIVKAILTNSGNANTCNGVRGDMDVQKMAQTLADDLNIKVTEVLICSTGVIGVPLTLNNFDEKVQQLTSQLTAQDSITAVEAMMTTDTHPKQLAYEFLIDQQSIKIAGITKGSGMIHPNLGTMLSYLVTDVALDQAELNIMLSKVVDNSFNRLTVDGDTSPNDTVFLASTGELKIEWNEEKLATFYQSLEQLCQDLAKMMAADGEGATKYVEVLVKGGQNQTDAVKIAKEVATSSLVKTAIFGQDANWGRIISAIGQCQPDELDPTKIDIAIASKKGQVALCSQGIGLTFDEESAAEIMSEKELSILIDLGIGNFQAEVWTCDMTVDYIKINADYRS